MTPREEITDLMGRLQDKGAKAGREECYTMIGRLAGDRSRALTLLYRLARHATNADDLNPALWAIETTKVLGDIRALDPAIYDVMLRDVHAERHES